MMIERRICRSHGRCNWESYMTWIEYSNSDAMWEEHIIVKYERAVRGRKIKVIIVNSFPLQEMTSVSYKILFYGNLANWIMTY